MVERKRKLPWGRLSVQEQRFYRVRIRARGWSMSEAARRIEKDQGLFSHWINGHVSSSVIRGRLNAVLGIGDAQ